MNRKQFGLALVFTWFGVGGIGHFVAPALFMSIMPPYIPYHLEAVYISGVLELLGVVGILIPSVRRAAGLGLILLTICVTPANVHMWLNPQLFPMIPAYLLSIRLIVQVLLIACIFWLTKNEESASPRA